VRSTLQKAAKGKSAALSHPKPSSSVGLKQQHGAQQPKRACSSATQPQSMPWSAYLELPRANADSRTKTLVVDTTGPDFREPRPVAPRLQPERVPEATRAHVALKGPHVMPSSAKSTAAPGIGPDSRFVDEGHDTRCWHFRVLCPMLCRTEEAGDGLRGLFPHSDPCKDFRERVVDWVVRLHKSYQLRSLTLFLSVLLVDRYLAACLKSKPRSLLRMVKRHRLLASTMLSIASKFEDEAVPEFASLAKSSKGEFQVADIHTTELQVLSQLDFHLHVPLAPHHLHWLLEAARAGKELRAAAEYVCEVGLESHELPKWKPQDHAAASVVLASMILNLPEWTPEFEASCGVAGNEEKRSSIMQALFGLCRALYRAGPGHAVYDKYCINGLAPRIGKTVAEVTGKTQ